MINITAVFSAVVLPPTIKLRVGVKTLLTLGGVPIQNGAALSVISQMAIQVVNPDTGAFVQWATSQGSKASFTASLGCQAGSGLTMYASNGVLNPEVDYPEYWTPVLSTTSVLTGKLSCRLLSPALEGSLALTLIPDIAEAFDFSSSSLQPCTEAVPAYGTLCLASSNTYTPNVKVDDKNSPCSGPI
jgi:hypothetical protein